MRFSFEFSQQRNSTDGSRKAFSLVEILVVTALAGVLMSLLLVAINAARGSARSLTCTNNLRQLGIAIQNYESTWRVIPRACGHIFSQDYSPWVAVMPQLEQTAVAKQILLELPFHETETESQLRVPEVLKCPADNTHSNYRVNVGAHCMASKGSGGGRGAFESTGNWLALASFTDGLSNTALASERMSGTGSKSRSSIAILRISPYIPDSDEFLSLLASESIGIRRCDVAGQYWNVGDLVHSWYNHVAPPNFRLDALLGGQSREGRPQGGSVAASSAHLGKVNVCMGDGSVAAQDSGIDVSVWRALGTRDAKD